MFSPLGGAWWAACTDPGSDSPLRPPVALEKVSQKLVQHAELNSRTKRLGQYVWAFCVIVHTRHGAEYLLVSLSKSQHNRRLGEHCGVHGFSVLQDTQRLVKVCSWVPHMSGKRKMIVKRIEYVGTLIS